jgi:hypothetical protein
MINLASDVVQAIQISQIEESDVASPNDFSKGLDLQGIQENWVNLIDIYKP